MPNRVTSYNDRTLFKATRALASNGKMTFEEALDAIDCLMDAGFLICEPAEKEEPKKVLRGGQADDKPDTEIKPAS